MKRIFFVLIFLYVAELFGQTVEVDGLNKQSKLKGIIKLDAIAASLGNISIAYELPINQLYSIEANAAIFNTALLKSSEPALDFLNGHLVRVGIKRFLDNDLVLHSSTHVMQGFYLRFDAAMLKRAYSFSYTTEKYVNGLFTTLKVNEKIETNLMALMLNSGVQLVHPQKRICFDFFCGAGIGFVQYQVYSSLGNDRFDTQGEGMNVIGIATPMLNNGYSFVLQGGIRLGYAF